MSQLHLFFIKEKYDDSIQNSNELELFHDILYKIKWINDNSQSNISLYKLYYNDEFHKIKDLAENILSSQLKDVYETKINQSIYML